MDRIEDCISFVVGKAAQAVSRRARTLLAPHGVTPPQYAALKVLSSQDGMALRDLVDRLVLDAPTVTGLADRLEGASLVARVPDPGGDRRLVRLALTAEGRRLLPMLDAAMDALNADMGERLGRDGATVFAALRRVAAE